jgi:hypothetical protein
MPAEEAPARLNRMVAGHRSSELTRETSIIQKSDDRRLTTDREAQW